MLNNYDLKGQNKKFAKTSAKETSFVSLTVDDCAKKCNEELTYECATFEYCYLNGDCKIRRDATNDNDPSEFNENNACDIYESKEKVNN